MVSSATPDQRPAERLGSVGPERRRRDLEEADRAIGPLHAEAPVPELDVRLGGLEEPGRDARAAGDDLVGGPRHHHRAEAHGAAGARSPTDGHAVGVPGDEAHLLEIDAQPLGQDLGEARLMPLPGRQRAEDELDPTPPGPR